MDCAAQNFSGIAAADAHGTRHGCTVSPTPPFKLANLGIVRICRRVLIPHWLCILSVYDRKRALKWHMPIPQRAASLLVPQMWWGHSIDKHASEVGLQDANPNMVPGKRWTRFCCDAQRSHPSQLKQAWLRSSRQLRGVPNTGSVPKQLLTSLLPLLFTHTLATPVGASFPAPGLKGHFATML